MPKLLQIDLIVFNVSPHVVPLIIVDALVIVVELLFGG